MVTTVNTYRDAVRQFLAQSRTECDAGYLRQVSESGHQ